MQKILKKLKPKSNVLCKIFGHCQYFKFGNVRGPYFCNRICCTATRKAEEQPRYPMPPVKRSVK